jgi:hypothetical protein
MRGTVWVLFLRRHFAGRERAFRGSVVAVYIWI